MSETHTDTPTKSDVLSIELPVPETLFVSDRGLKYVRPNGDDRFQMHERSIATGAFVAVNINNDRMAIADAELFALNLLWLVRNHYQGYDLMCEITKEDGKHEAYSRGVVALRYETLCTCGESFLGKSPGESYAEFQKHVDEDSH
jgi:hypothetical protein